nr:hypothetical protein CFP56_66108 [Quercus suber]
MSDPSNVHPTLAGNRLDPNIEADGHLNAGQGVGGTAERTIQKEGIEHVKQQTFGSSDAPSSQSQSQSQSQVHQEGIDHIKSQTFGSEPAGSHANISNALGSEPPASNPSADDATGGISQGSGGVSNTANIQSPVQDEPQTIIGSTVEGIKSYLGFGASQKEAQDATPGYGTTSGVTRADTDGPVSEYNPSTAGTTTTTTNTSNYADTAAATAAGLGATAAAGTAAYTGSQYAADTADSLDQTRQARESAAGTSTGTGLDTSASSTSYNPSNPSNPTNTSSTSASTTSAAYNPSNTMSDSSDPSQAERRVQDKTADDVPTTDAKGISPDQRGVEDAETTTGADKQTEDTTDADQAGAGPGDVGETNKPPAAAGGHSGAVENKSAIPTAGGERLGEKHWGESKIVPDLPKAQGESQAGVSSADGQPTSQVKDNTAANTGGATGGPNTGNTTSSSSAGAHSDATEKEGLVDKIKDKLHIGKK